MPGLTAEANLLWAALGGARDVAKTSWIGVRDVPRCGLERLALEILRFHFPTEAARRDVVGAEFWTQLRTSEHSRAEQGLALHYDKDEVAVDTWDIWAHPELATATYLSGGGAPLLVYSTRSRDDGSSSEEEESEAAAGVAQSVAAAPAGPEPACGSVCFPRKARHVAFDGNLLHGVPEELLWLDEGGVSKEALSSSSGSNAQGGGEYSRLSFLVNMWTSHRPERVNRVPKRLAARLEAASAASVASPLLRRSPSQQRPSAQRGMLALRRGQQPATPLRRRVVAGTLPSPGQRGGRRAMGGRLVPGTGLYALRQHLDGDTGLLPAAAVARARRAAVAPIAAGRPAGRGGPAGRRAAGAAPGLLEVCYAMPPEKKKLKAAGAARSAVAAAARKRPAASGVRTSVAAKRQR